MFTNALFTAAVACGLLASSVNAHMVITSPVPYGQDSLNNSPLEADGSDFPCKQRAGVYDMTTMNTMPIGVPQKLAFKGGATHGGGSCQISITSDEKPTKDSTWKVIHSIIGGCPNGAAGNADGSPTFAGNPTFEFSVPKGVPNGKYTLAWTWFNKIGNREMYMNCAPITVTGSTSKRDGASSGLDSFPDMFVANIGNGCGTTETEDYVFPQPGLYVETVAKTALGTSTTGTCPTGAAGGSGSGSGSSAASPTASYGSNSGSESGTSAPAYGGSSAAAATTAPSYGGVATSVASAPAYSSPAEQGSGSDASDSGSSGGMLTVTTLATVTGTGSAPAAPEATGYSNSSGPASSDSGSASGTSASSNSTSTSSGSCSGGGVSCSTDGAVVCMGSNQWGLCNAGCAVPASLASGTTCSNGVIAKRDSASHIRRHLKHAKAF